ncbi:hypothetical protein [Halalkalibacter nanhaiisediminis]|uniref:DUF4367 domain-containing protein n=1 Tax=Halalkalibacter nanhaiisediminis TaxID=688079 RepID=A0A562QEZ1_9BACI|nr:hypothetical protein [Halalkalibacter nanhaiisediminis]TWI54606.1 hypothetical protein IQ10_02827 [Halalkalibacter nanhaiisediminis]
MNDQQMKDMLDKLKEHYDDMPTKSSSTEIMSHIKKEKRPRWGSFFHKWQAVAMIVLALGIGSVLTIGQLGEFGSSFHLNDESITETEEAEVRTFDEPAEESTTEESAAVEDRTQEQETTTEVIMIEGMEETITVKDVFDDTLGFSTKVDERYEIETVSTAESYSLQVFASYTGERVTPFFFSVTAYQQVESLNELESLIGEEYTEAGYTERSSEGWLPQQETELSFVKVLSFEAHGTQSQIGIVEHNDTYYTFTVNWHGEALERVDADTRVILRHARFIE